jgi:hypothetical protein
MRLSRYNRQIHNQQHYLNYQRFYVFVALLLVGALLPSLHAEIIPFDSPRWEIPPNAARVEDYLGQKSLSLKGGVAYLKDVDFTDGIIEFDVAFRSGRGFFGGVFRMLDKDNYEEFYLRSHQSGNPDAIQYTPVYNGMAAWQLYYGNGFGAATEFKFKEWIHVKLVVSGKYAELYLGNSEHPVLFMHDLKRSIKPGRVGIKANRFAAGNFANFSVTPMDNPPLKNKPVSTPSPKSGTVMAWSVSNTFPESLLKNKLLLSDADKKMLKWSKLESEASGLANISKSVKLQRQNNTAFTRVIIESGKKEVKGLLFGFSDRVMVYLNDRLIYAGNNNYRSRDYRFLGTIGYFDRLYLPLKKGRNELWFAVSENFGGWGVKCRFDEPDGLVMTTGL